MKLVPSLYHRLLTVAAQAYHSLFFPAFVVLAVVLTVTFWTAKTASVALERNLQLAMDSQAVEMQRAISARIKSHEVLLQGSSALVQSNSAVDATQWRLFSEALNYKKDFPSIEGMGVAKYSDDRSALTVAYIAPDDLSPGIGTNLLTVPAYTRLNNIVQSTHATALVAESSAGGHMLIGIPLYNYGQVVNATNKMAAVTQGLIYEKISADKFFQRVSADASLRNVGVKVFVGTSTEPAYATQGYDDLENYTSMTRTYSSFGQAIRVEYRFEETSLVSKTQLDGPLLIASGGVLAGILIASIVYLLLKTRARELQIEKAQDVDIAKDDLLSLASHQLRTPATGVKQYLGMVLQGFAGPVSERQRSLLEKANSSNDRQLSVINEVLHLAKLDAGRIVLSRQRINLSELVQDVVVEQTSDIKKSKHVLKLQLPVKPVMINADGHMLRMAIENLVSNAVKYTPEHGKIQVSVVTAGPDAKVVVADSGIGIKHEDMPKLFQQFSRIPNEMSNRVSGTGVGLYLSKSLVELHGGSLTVASVAGKGSTFVISLPRIILSAPKRKKV